MNRFFPLAAIVFLFIPACRNQESGSWLKVEVKPFESLVKANGEMASSDTTKIGCPMVDRMWEFTIKFLAPEGKKVEQGQLILAFDDKDLRNQLQMEMTKMGTAEKELEKTVLNDETQLEDLKLNVAEAEMNLKKAKRKAELDEEELSSNDVKKNLLDYEMAIRKLEISKKRVTGHQIEMESKQKSLANNLSMFRMNVEHLQHSIESMQVKSPKSGMLVHVANWRGEKPVVGDSVYRGLSVLEIPELSSMIVKALIREPDAGKVAPGQEVRITLDANTDRTFKGKVSSLGQLYHMKSWDQPYMVFDAVIDIHNPDPELMRPGMKAKVEIISERHENAIVVPLAAVHFTDGGALVSIQSKLGRKEVPVTTGKISRDNIRILSGLKGGETLWIP